MRSRYSKAHAHNVWPNIEKFLNDLADTNLSDFGINEFESTRPSANIIEDDAAFTLELAAPGMRKEDFTVNLRDGVLTITAKADKTEHTYKRREFDYSEFKRTFKITEKVKADAISARYENGILYVVMPRNLDDEKNHKIHVS